MTLGYALSSEEHRPLDLVRNAAQAEEATRIFAELDFGSDEPEAGGEGA